MGATEISPEAGVAGPNKPLRGFARLFAPVVALDHALLRFLAGLKLPKAVTWPLILFVRTGDGWLWVLIAFYLWMALPFAVLKTLVLNCLLSLAFSLALYWPIKLAVRRIRPHENGHGVTAKVPPLDKFSFPSGHTMNNLAVALTVAAYRPDLILPALLLPLGLGLLRILFGVHYFSDISGGAVLGAAAFFISKAVFPFLHR